MRLWGKCSVKRCVAVMITAGSRPGSSLTQGDEDVPDGDAGLPAGHPERIDAEGARRAYQGDGFAADHDRPANGWH